MSDTVSVGTGHSQRDCPAGPLASGTVPRIWVDVCVCVCVGVCVGVCVCIRQDLSFYSVDFNRAGLIFFVFFCVIAGQKSVF